MANIIETYLHSEQEVVGYDAWIFWHTKKDSDRISCAKLIEKDGETYFSDNNISCSKDSDKLSCMIEDVIDILAKCVDANIVTIHVSDFRIVRILKFGFIPKRLLSIVSRYKKLVGETEVIFVKDKWYEEDHHNSDVEKMAKEKFKEN